MTGPVELLNHAADSWWLYMASAACQSALVGLLLLAIVYLARKWSSTLKYWILVIALAKFAFPTLLPSPTGLFTWLGPVAHLDARTADSTTEETQIDGRTFGDPTLAARVNAEKTLDNLARASRAESKAQLSVEAGVWKVEWRAWLLLIYVGGLLVLAWRVLREMLLLRRFARHSQEIVGGELHDCLKTIGSQFHMNRLPRLMHSADVTSPVAFGAFRPTIVIPTRMIDRFHRRDFEIVLAHEMAHVCRGDIWLNWLQVVVCAAWWFHPVAWVISRALSKVREDCCDDLILAWNVADRTRYCDTLLRVARDMKDAVFVGAAVGMTERFHPLSKRLTRILKGAVPPSGTVSAAGWAVLLVGAMVLLPGSRYGDVEAGPETASDQRPTLAGANSAALDENTFSSEAKADSHEATMNSKPREPIESPSAKGAASASVAAAGGATFQMDSGSGKTAVKPGHRLFVVSADGTKSVQLDEEGSNAARSLDASRGTPAAQASGPQICIYAPPDDRDEPSRTPAFSPADSKGSTSSSD